MTQDERKMLSDLADKFTQTPAPPKDSEAEDFIRTRIGSRPDALYLMTQTVLIQNLALQQAQRQIQDLQNRSGQSSSSGSFLGSQPPARSSGYASSGYSQPAGGQGYAAPPPPQYAAAPAAQPAPVSGAPSFLRGAAQTAAGVAAGALAFEGIQALFSHPGYGGGSGFGGFGGGPVGETVVNNYYDDPSGSRQDVPANFDDQGQQFVDPGQFNDANSDVVDDSSLDNSSLDDTSVADDSTFDDGGSDTGGFDDGGGDNYA